MTYLTSHFTLEELTFSSTAQRLGLDNTPSPDIIENLKQTAQLLEQVRALLGYAMHIDSGYRSPKVNSAVGGSKSSAHMDGRAADFVCHEYGDPFVICQLLANHKPALGFDQLIYEHGWVHIAWRDDPRGDVLSLMPGGVYAVGVAA